MGIHLVQRFPIEKGWSRDKKYCAVDERGEKYLLRISAVEQFEKKRREFQLMEEVAALGVTMCRPLEFGVSSEGVYSVQSWIEGVNAEEAIPSMPGDAQYSYGVYAGRLLREIHKIPAPEGTEDWASYYNRKADHKIKIYAECPVKYEGGQAFIDCINTNRHLLKDRPSTYQHGDYHIGNMMIGDDKKLYIIDFDRDDFGDPWEEFNRIVWCALTAPPFATGMVDGYFDRQVPPEFWKLLALYTSSNTLGSVSWAMPFGQKKVDEMVELAKLVLGWYDGMKKTVPGWYQA